MKKYFLILITFLSINAYSQVNEFKWEDNFTIARTVSKSQDKPILVYFTDNSKSEASMILDSEFFQSERFKALSNKVVLLLVDTSNGDVSNERLNIHYNKSNIFPALVLLDANGSVFGDVLKTITTATINNYFSFLDSKTK